MIRKKKLAARTAPPHPSGKVMDVTPAGNFPKLGSTLSSYNPLLTHTNVASSSHAPQSAVVKADQKIRRRRRLKKALKWTVLIIVFILVVSAGWVGFKFARDASKIFGGNIFGLLHSTTLKGESQGRVNILLAGNSADDPGHNGANLTDSIMVVSIDTKNNSAFLLSIPRDMWVNIPGYGYQKINAAYEDGQAEHFNQSGYTSGGMGLLEQVVDQDFGIASDYSALISYDAIRDAVNAVGGIQVNIQSSDPRGLYDPDIDYTTHTVLVDLTNGEHTLNGEQALDLARARGDAYGSYGFPLADFNRTANQRMMLLAIKSKATSLSVLSNPIKLGELFDSLGNNVATDLTASDARTLYDLSKKISNSNVQSVGFNDVNGTDLLQSYTSDDGESALIPAAGFDNYSAIQAYVTQLLTPPTTTNT